MNRKFTIVMMTIWTVIAIVFIIILARGLQNKSMPYSNINFDFKSKNQIVKEETLPINGINNLVINSLAENVIIHTSSDADLRMVASTNEDNKVSLYKENDTMVIKSEDYGNVIHFGLYESEKIDVYIPTTYNGNIEITSTSGDVSVQDALVCNNFKCEETSGELEIFENLKANTVELKSISGDIDISKNIMADNIVMHTTSGEIEASELQAKTYTISTTSGDSRIYSLVGSGDISSSSGEIEVMVNDLNGNMTLTSTSGDVDLSLKETVEGYLEVGTSSGDISGNIDFRYNKNGDRATAGDEASNNRIKVQTSSGEVTINTVS